jgi:exonuclease III
MNQTQGHISTLQRTLMDLRAKIEPKTVIVGDLNILLSLIDRSSSQKIQRQISVLIHMLDQMDILDIYRIFHPTIR